MKVSNEAARQQWRTDGMRSEDPQLAERLLDAAEAWAEAMEPTLDQGTDIATIAVKAFLGTAPTFIRFFFDHSSDYMVDYLEACWEYGPVLRTWYETNRPVARRAEDEK